MGNADPTEFSAGSYRELRSRQALQSCPGPRAQVTTSHWTGHSSVTTSRGGQTVPEGSVTWGSHSSVLGKPQRRTQLGAVKLETAGGKEWASRGRWESRQTPTRFRCPQSGRKETIKSDEAQARALCHPYVK